MARLRLVGRPGRRFGNKGLRFADHGGGGDGDGPKTRLIVNVHRGLRDFVSIAGGDSDDEEDFHGFTEDEIQLVIKKTTDLLALVKSAENVAESSVEEIGGRLRQRVQKTTAKPFLQLVKSRYNRHLFLTSTPLTSGKRQFAKSLSSSSLPETSSKPMKGNIKVRLLGKGFLLKKPDKRPVQSNENFKSKEEKKLQKMTLTASSQEEKPLKRSASMKVIRPKMDGRRVKEILLKEKQKRLINRNKVARSVKYRLVDSKTQGKLRSESAESSPKKRVSVTNSSSSDMKTKKSFIDVEKSAKKLNRRMRRMSENRVKHGGKEDKRGLLKQFHLRSENIHSQKKNMTKKRFRKETSAESAVKKPRLIDAEAEDFSENKRIAERTFSIDESHNLLLLPENQDLLRDVPKKIPMFDAPLICDSKRHRRPAQKLIMKWSEDYDLNLKRCRKSFDVMTAGVEGDNTFDMSPKSAKNNQITRSSAKTSSGDGSVSQSLVSKSDLSVSQTTFTDGKDCELPLLPNPSSVLVQKNKDLSSNQSERENSKTVRKRKTCCICSGTHKLNRYIGCRSLCCRNCFRFYSSRAKLVMKGSLNLLCVSGGCCTINWKTVSSCDACRYRKCLEYFPPPEEVVNLKSSRKNDVVRREKHQSEFPLAPITKDSPWNAELLKFLKASQVQEEFLGTGDTSNVDAANLSTATSLDRNLSSGPSRRLCKLGKSRTTATSSSEMTKNSDTNTFSSPGPLSGSSFTISNLNKSDTTEVHNELKANEILKLRNSPGENSASETLIRCETELSCPRSLDGDQLNGKPPFCASPKPDTSGQEISPEVPEKYSKGPEVEGSGGTDSDGSEWKGNKGPRIKHVCRKAAVVLGKPQATFPPHTKLCLSALPSQEKERILQHEDDSQGSLDETNGITKEQMAKNTNESESPSKKSISKKSKNPKRFGGPKKTLRCKKCVGCLTPECGACTACRDMPKNGGRGTLKHACIHRICRNPILPWNKLSPEKLAKAKLEKEREAEQNETMSVVKKITAPRLQTSLAFNRPRGRPRMPLISGKKFQSKLNSITGSNHLVSKVRPLRMLKTSASVDDKLDKNLMSNKSKTSEQQLPQMVKVDFNESTDIEVAWKRGLAVYSLSSCSLRAVCRLCRCVGQQELIFCSVCCEPFHSFCLEERDRPKDGCDTWCCLQCQFCHVCYGQSNLLQCDKCQESYHPECLGPNYPTKPSRRKRIWVCSKCVRCRSCGATTPGQDKDATWMCDFSLCYTCGLLMEKGNFCPVCRKCYTDDDWESQMIQCFTCHSWVHSKCEELTDEMYQIVTYMPEDVPFNCRVCCPTRPSVWEVLIQQEMQGGMKSILDALVQCKLSSMLDPIKDIDMQADGALSVTKDVKFVAVKQSCEDDERIENRFICLDEQQRSQCSVKESENRNSDAIIIPDVKCKDSVNDTFPLLVAPVAATEATDHQDLVNSNKNLKDSVLSDIEVVELNDTSCTSNEEFHALSSKGRMTTKEANAENIDDCQTYDLESSILDLNKAILTVTALDNFCPQLKSVSSPDGKLHSLLQHGPNIKGFQELSKDVPRDLAEIRTKLEKENGYTTIEEFAADVAGIIRYNMEMKEDEATSLRVKACASVRTLFVKQMEKCFPWFNVKNSRCWSASSQSPKCHGVMDEAVNPPSEDHTYAHWLEKEAVPPPPQPSLFRNTGKESGPCFESTLTKDGRRETEGQPEDTRCCAFCWTYGDADDEEAGRLISAGQDDWVHVNCALWSAEVYEEIDGTLKMVHAALARSRKLRCDMCGKPGATVGCCQQGCNSNFHFACARRKNCAFLETKKVFCELHWMAVDADLIADGNFAVSRRICINPTSNRWTKRQWVMGVDPSSINVLIGSLVVESLGRLSPLSDSKPALLPVDFCVSRLFWSTEDPRRRSIYVCRIVEVIPKTKAPEIINDITVTHDKDDPHYDMTLAMSFTFTAKDLMSDESTLSAFEDDLDLSDSEIESSAHESRKARPDRKESQTQDTNSLPVSVEGVLKYPHQSSGLSRSYPDWMNLEMPYKELSSLKMSRSFSGVFEDNLPLKLFGYSQLSASTLKMLGLQNNAANAQSPSAVVSTDNRDDDELMLVKIASRLNEAAAKNRMQEFHKRMGRDGDNANPIEMLSSCKNTAKEGSKIGEASLDLSRLSETAQFGNRTENPEAVIIKNLVQMDGPAGESDSEDCCSEDLNLVADFSSDNETSQGPTDQGLHVTSPRKRSLSLVNTDATDVECNVNSMGPVHSKNPSGCTEDSVKISDGLLSTNCHLMNDATRAETSGFSVPRESFHLSYTASSVQPPFVLSSSPTVQMTSTKLSSMALPTSALPLLTASELMKNLVTKHTDSAGAAAVQPATEIVHDPVRPVLLGSGLQPSAITGLNSSLGLSPRFALSAPSAPEGTTILPSQVRLALSQLLNSNNVSYLGSMAVTSPNATSLQQVINNLQQLPVQQSRMSSPFGLTQFMTGLPSVRPVPFGISNPPQIQVATPNSGVTPQILKSLQQALGTSRASQPVFFKLVNSNPGEQPLTSAVESGNFPSSSLNLPSVNKLQDHSAWLSSPLGVLPSQTPELNQNIVNAIPLYASSQALPPAEPAVSGMKRHLFDSTGDIHSKRMKLAGTGGMTMSRSTEGRYSSPVESSYSRVHIHSAKDVDNYKINFHQDPALPADRSNHLQKKSHSRPFEGQGCSVSSFTNVLGDSNHSEGGQTNKFGLTKKNPQKTSLGNNRKSKPEPMFEPHPMFRPHLPEAEVEEEIENSPLLAMFETEQQRMKEEEAEQKKNAPHLVFEITSSDGFHVQADSLNKAWKAVTDRVQDARLSAGMKPVSFIGVNGLYMTGLSHPAIVYLVEQLPGFKRFHNYEFKYHPPPQFDEEEDEIIENPRGCARAEQFSGRNKCETFSFLLSRYRNRPEYDPNTAHEENIMANKSQRRCTSLDLPMAMRFRHLRTFAKEAVGVYRSNIHGRGLFCKRDIDAGEMIIEYSGEVIRAILTDKREKHYESKAMGCYMFRKDRDHVIDSTMMGNAARFINHSCDPNCYSKVILVDNRKHIVIFAQRAIKRGEELTYDYKFPIEDVKIPCTCNSRRCRKYLN